MREKTSNVWLILLAILAVGFTLILSQTSGASMPVFTSPVFTPIWEQAQETPTPRPQPTIAPTTGPATLNTGLKGYWNLDEANTGNRADSSPLGYNTLSNINGVSWKAGKIGKASDFERSANQYLKIEQYEAVGLNFSHSVTLVGWIKRESINQTMALAGRQAVGTGINERDYLFLLNSGNKLRLVVSPDGVYSAGYAVNGGTNLTSTGSWYHVAAVFDAYTKRLKLYLNGNLEANKTVSYSTIFQADAPFMLGANLSNGSAVNRFDGLMDDWRVYNRALSQSEIQALMNQQ